MYVIEVIPLKRGLTTPRLSYFSSQSYKLGIIISVPVRKSTTPAVVVKVEAVLGAKATIKAATFSLRKLPPDPATETLPPILTCAAEELLTRYPIELGALLFTWLPPEIRSGKYRLPKLPPSHSSSEKIKTEAPKVMAGTRRDRYIEYRSLVRETFARDGSVLFVVPTTVGIEFAKAGLESGIEDRVISFSRTDSVARRKAAYTALADLKQTKLIITTPAHAYLDRHDIKTMIIEEAGSIHYATRRHPYIHHLDALGVIAKCAGRQLILGDLVVRTEEEVERRSDNFYTLGEHPKRLTLPGKLLVIKQKPVPTQTEPFSLFSPNIVTAVSNALKRRNLVYMYAARRGLAPVVACRDCSYIFRCPDSETPYSLLRTKNGGEEKRWFISGTSGKRVRAADVCTNCGSWRLWERGIGIQYVHDALLKLFPTVKIILFDHTTATTHKKSIALSRDFYEAKQGAILLGTNMSIPYLAKPVTMSVVTSIDALSANTTWRNGEEVFKLLLTLREKSKESVLVQTRHEFDNVIGLAKEGALNNFYNNEITLRQVLNYPPFMVFIHLTWKGSQTTVCHLKEVVADCLKDYPITFYASPYNRDSKFTEYGLLRQPTPDWPEGELLNRLKSLPPAVRVMINPDRIV